MFRLTHALMLVALVPTLAVAVGVSIVNAQTPPQYGAPISIDDAKKAAAAAIAEARTHGFLMAVAIADPSGALVYFEKMDHTQHGSIAVAIGKARTSALFKRPTKAFQDNIAAGGEGLRTLAVDGVVPIEGGLPLFVNGKVVGAIGVSGGTPAQDGQCAKPGADVLATR